MGKSTSRILNERIASSDPNTGPLVTYCRQFASWTIKDVRLLHHRFLKNPTGYGLVKSQFEALLAFKKDVQRFEEVFNVLDEDSNGRIDALEFIAAVAQCCKGSFDDKSRFCFELVDFNVNGSLCFEELVLMMRSCVIGLLKFMGEREIPDDEEFEGLAELALNSAKESSHLDPSETPALSFPQFTEWANGTREVLNALEKMSSRALVNARREESDDESAPEATSEDDSDLEEEHMGIHERALQATEASTALELADQELVKMLAGEGNAGDEFMAVKPWVGTIKEPTELPKLSVDVPDASLVLEWVHGFSAQQARNNLRYTQDGTIVYFAAALGVVYDRKTHTQRFYHGHTDDIVSMAIHPDLDLVATGQIGKNPGIHVWDPLSRGKKNDINTKAKLSGFHRRGVSLLAFNQRGDRLASIGLDDDHSIAIYDWRRKLLVASGKGDKNKVLACEYTPDGQTLVICGVKFIKFFTKNGKALVCKRGIIGRKGKIQAYPCMGFCGNNLVVGCADGSLYQFEGHKVKNVISRAHGGGGMNAVTAMYWWKDGILTGGKDATVKVWNTNMQCVGQPLSIGGAEMGSLNARINSVCMGTASSKSDNTILVGTRAGEILCIELPNEEKDSGDDTFVYRMVRSHFKGEVWGLAVHPHKNRYATCGDDGTIRLWDIEYRRQRGVRVFKYKAKACAFSPDGKRLAVALDAAKDPKTPGGWVVILTGDTNQDSYTSESVANLPAGDRNSWKALKVIKGDAKKWGQTIKYSPNGKLLAFGSHDNRIYLYNTIKDTYSKRAICKGHSSYITHLDFSIDSKYLQTNCGAYELLYWDVGGNQITSATKMRDRKWATWTCTLGWPVQAIWPKGADGTDINAVCRSASGDLVVTSDDFSRVKLFRYPAVQPGTAFKTYEGHAEHVTNVRFAFGDRHVISTGGMDRCVFQWRCEYEEQEEVEIASADEDVHSDLENELGHDLTRTELQEAANEDGGNEDLAELFQQGGGDEFMAVKPWLGTISVMKPKGFDKKKVSTGAPDCDMELAWVHGYRAFDCRNNLRYTAKGDMVYPAAALGIVSNKRQQRFFNLHTDDVISLAVHPQGKVVATGEIGRKPKIICWDSETLLAVTIMQGFHKRGVPLLAFSGGKGDKLVSVGLDNDFSIAVYAWQENHLIASCKSAKTKVLCVEFGADDQSVITCGVNHVKFWTIKGSTLKCQKGIYGTMPKIIRNDLKSYGGTGSKKVKASKKRDSGKLNLIQTALCIGSFKLQKSDGGVETRYVTGMMDGALYIWNDYKLETIERGHVKANAKSAVTAMYSHNDAFFTGDKQGKIKIWETNRCYNLEEAVEETRKYKKLKKAYHEHASSEANSLDERKEKRIAMLQGKYRCELLKKPLVCLFTIDLEAGPTSHAWMFNSYDSARPKGPHVDGPIKSELRSLCYKDGKLLIGTKCSSVYEADCQPPRVKVRKAINVLQKELMDNIDKCVAKTFERAFADDAGDNHARLLDATEELKEFEMWTDLDYYNKRISSAFYKYIASGDLVAEGEGEGKSKTKDKDSSDDSDTAVNKGGNGRSLFDKSMKDDEKNSYFKDNSPRPVTVVCQGHYVGELWGLAMHRSKPRFMTCGDDGTARLWDIHDKTCIRAVKLGVEGSQNAPLPACGKVLSIEKENGKNVISFSTICTGFEFRRKRENHLSKRWEELKTTKDFANAFGITDEEGKCKENQIKIHGAGVEETTYVEKIELSESSEANIVKVTLSSENALSKMKIGMWMTFTMNGNKRPLASKGKARACAFSPPRSGDDSAGASKFARQKLEESHVAFGIDDGTIEVWDAGLRRFVERIDEKKLQTGVSIAAEPEEKNTVTKDKKYKKGKHFPKEWIQDMKYSQKGNFLAVGSHDNKIYVYRRKGKREINTEVGGDQSNKVSGDQSDKGDEKESEIAGLEEGRYELYCVCAKHSSYITHLDFSEGNIKAFERSSKLPSPDDATTEEPKKATREEIDRVHGGMHCYNGDLDQFKTNFDENKEKVQWYESFDSRYLMSTCGGYELLFWDLHPASLIASKKSGTPYFYAKQVTRVSTLKDIEWHTFTMPLGWNVQGIWPPRSDGTDINAVARSRNKTLCATADDFGRVKLFRWPCVSNKAQSKNYRGHASHVTNIFFSEKDEYVISTGGSDNCIFMWQTDYNHQEQLKLEQSQERPDSSGSETSDSDDDSDEVDPFKEVGAGDEFMAVKPWKGAIVAPSKWKEGPEDADEPEKELVLENIYGYSAHRRDGVFYSSSPGEIVYFAAAAGVVNNFGRKRSSKNVEQEQHFNLAHTDDILCMAMHPSGNRVATGEVGRKPKIIVWDVHSTNVLLTIAGFHRFGIELLAWSPSGIMLATIGRDSDHSIAIYDGESGSMVANAKGHQNKVHAICFKTETDIVTAGVKHVKFWTMGERKISGKNGLFKPKGKIQTVLAVAALGANIVTGQKDGSLYLWQGRNVQDLRKGVHKGPILALVTLNVNMGNGVLSGGKDGKIFLWDRTLTPSLKFDMTSLDPNVGPVPKGPMDCAIHSLDAKHGHILAGVKSAEVFHIPFDGCEDGSVTTTRVVHGHYDGETWGLECHPDQSEFVTVGDDATIRRWDAVHRRLLCVEKLECKARAVTYAPESGSQIAVGTTSGNVIVYDSSNLSKPLKKVHVTKEWIEDLKYSKNGKILAVSSHDNRIYLFNRKTYNQYAVLKGHSSYITHIDFSYDEKTNECKWLQSNCGAYELLFWDTTKGKRNGKASALRDVNWGTWTCVLGWPVQGIWQAEQDGTDINAVDRSNSRDKPLLVTGDDNGKVTLFRYPCSNPNALGRVSKGHSSHVTNVRFLYNDSHVVSTGGGDRCVFQWKLINSKTVKKATKDGKKSNKRRVRRRKRR